MPARWSCSYSPENGRSVAFSRSTAYCIGDSSLRHSVSLLTSLLEVLVSDMESPSVDRHCERSEAIHYLYTGKMDCFVASLLAMTRVSIGGLGVAHQCRLL